MSERSTLPALFKVIQETENGPVVWGTFNTTDELSDFLRYMLKSTGHGAMKDFKVSEIYLEREDHDLYTYAAFLGLGDRKEVT